MRLETKQQTALKAVELAFYGDLIRGDVDAVARRLHPELLYVHSDGVQEGRDDYLRALADNHYDYERIESSEDSFRNLGNGVLVAARTWMSVATGGGPHVGVGLRSLLIWVREGDGWQLLMRQATRIP